MISLKNTKLLVIILLLPILTYSQENLSSKTAKVRLFSSTPIEDIKAASDKGTAILVPKSQIIAFQVPIKSFQFDKGLMQDHFNENYLESDKYPFAKFKGKINQDINFAKSGEYNITATGTLLIHGVEKPRTISGRIRISDSSVQLLSSFDVACVDHNIKIPTVVVTKVAEVINVKVDANLTPLTK
jgi:hypothetical protein